MSYVSQCFSDCYRSLFFENKEFKKAPKTNFENIKIMFKSMF